MNTGLGQMMSVALAASGIVPTTGRIYFVGKAGLAGLNEVQAMYPGNYPDGSPVVYSTIKLALAGGCVANRGDVIFVLPGHTENVANATDLNLNVAGVTIIGLGAGSLRPTITLTTAITATITASAANITVANMVFDLTGFDAITSGFTVTANNFAMRGCSVTTATASGQVAIALTATTVVGFTLDNNRFTGTGDAGTTNCLQLIAVDDAVITNNYFSGAYTTSLGPINNITTACLRMKIDNNVLINATASSTKVIVLVAGSTGAVTNNRIAILSGTAPITGAGLNHVGGNYYTAAAGVTAGTLL